MRLPLQPLLRPTRASRGGSARGSANRLHRSRGDHLGCSRNRCRTRVQRAGDLYYLAHLRLQILTGNLDCDVSDLVHQQKMSALLSQSASDVRYSGGCGSLRFERQSRARCNVRNQHALRVDHLEGAGQSRHAYSLIPQHPDPAGGDFTTRAKMLNPIAFM